MAFANCAMRKYIFSKHGTREPSRQRHTSFLDAQYKTSAQSFSSRLALMGNCWYMKSRVGASETQNIESKSTDSNKSCVFLIKYNHHSRCNKYSGVPMWYSLWPWCEHSRHHSLYWSSSKNDISCDLRNYKFRKNIRNWT